MDRASFTIMMVLDTKESGRMAKEMDRASITVRMVIDTKDSGRMAQ